MSDASKTYLVDITEYDMFHHIVLQDLTHNTAIATTYDENLLRVWVTGEREMRNHLLVAARRLELIAHLPTVDSREFIALSALNDTIKDENVPVRL